MRLQDYCSGYFQKNQLRSRSLQLGDALSYSTQNAIIVSDNTWHENISQFASLCPKLIEVFLKNIYNANLITNVIKYLSLNSSRMELYSIWCAPVFSHLVWWQPALLLEHINVVIYSWTSQTIHWKDELPIITVHFLTNSGCVQKELQWRVGIKVDVQSYWIECTLRKSLWDDLYFLFVAPISCE